MSVDPKKIRTSPVGIAVWPKLVKPDTKFDKGGAFSTRLKFTDKAVEEKFAAELQAISDEAYKDLCIEKKRKTLKRADNPWKPEIEVIKDDEGTIIEERPTGLLVFNFKLKASGKGKDGAEFHRKLTLFDAKGTAIKGEIAIGGGSLIKVAFTARPFFTDSLGAGISLQMKGVQIIKIVEPGGISSEACGFGVEDGGYVDDGGESQSMPSAPGNEAPDPTGPPDASDF